MLFPADPAPVPPAEFDHIHALPPSFFAGDPVAVARSLLGAVLVRTLPTAQVLAARIVETEAYDCPRDPSCHVIVRLPGAAAMLAGPPGTVYFHYAYDQPLLNVVCRPEGVQAAILVRAAEPVWGEATMRELRPVKRRTDLSNGPAKLMTALGMSADLKGAPIDRPGFHIVPGETVADSDVQTTSRVGLRRGADLPWRFLIAGNPWVSPGKPSMNLSPV